MKKLLMMFIGLMFYGTAFAFEDTVSFQVNVWSSTGGLDICKVAWMPVDDQDNMVLHYTYLDGSDNEVPGVAYFHDAVTLIKPVDPEAAGQLVIDGNTVVSLNSMDLLLASQTYGVTWKVDICYNGTEIWSDYDPSQFDHPSEIDVSLASQNNSDYITHSGLQLEVIDTCTNGFSLTGGPADYADVTANESEVDYLIPSCSISFCFAEGSGNRSQTLKKETFDFFARFLQEHFPKNSSDGNVSNL